MVSLSLACHTIIICYAIDRFCSARAVTWPQYVDCYAIDRLSSAVCDMAGVIYAASE